jgi:hypothetical protein
MMNSRPVVCRIPSTWDGSERSVDGVDGVIPV